MRIILFILISFIISFSARSQSEIIPTNDTKLTGVTKQDSVGYITLANLSPFVADGKAISGTYNSGANAIDIDMDGATDFSIDLAAFSAAFAVGSGAIDAFTYWTTPNHVFYTNGLYWNSTDNRITITSVNGPSFGANKYLQVLGTAVADPGLAITDGARYSLNNTTNPYVIGLGDLDGSQVPMFFQTGGGNGGGFEFFQGTTEMARIHKDGKFGVNVIPTSGIHLVSFGNTPSTSAFLLENSSLTDLFEVKDDGLVSIYANNLSIGSNWISNDGDAEGISISSTGDVGIGTGTTSATLDINGDLEINTFGTSSTHLAGVNSSNKVTKIIKGNNINISGDTLNAEIYNVISFKEFVTGETVVTRPSGDDHVIITSAFDGGEITELKGYIPVCSFCNVDIQLRVNGVAKGTGINITSSTVVTETLSGVSLSSGDILSLTITVNSGTATGWSVSAEIKK